MYCDKAIGLCGYWYGSVTSTLLTFHLVPQYELEEQIVAYTKEHDIDRRVIFRWRKVFVMLDFDEGGTLDVDELKTGFVELGVLDREYDIYGLLQKVRRVSLSLVAMRCVVCRCCNVRVRCLCYTYSEVEPGPLGALRWHTP